jgi:hypothetical protein
LNGAILHSVGSGMKPGFLLEAARKNVKSTMQGGFTICVISLLVLLLNGKYVYNWVAGPFPMNSALANSPGMKEFSKVEGTLIPTGLAEQNTTTLRILRAVKASNTSVSANYYLFPLDNQFVVVKAGPDFSGNFVRGRLVPLPERIRRLPQLSEIKVADGRMLTSENLYPTMLDATFSYRADANLFVIVAAFFLVVGLLVTLTAMSKAGSPQKYPMLRFVARTGPVVSALRRIEQEFIAAGDDAHVGPLLISSGWVHDPGRDALIFPMKDIVAVAKKISVSSGKTPSCSVEFWLRNETRSHSTKAGDEECGAIINAIGAHIPWAMIEPGSSFESDWRRDRQGCIREMERRKKQQDAPVTR